MLILQNNQLVILINKTLPPPQMSIFMSLTYYLPFCIFSASELPFNAVRFCSQVHSASIVLLTLYHVPSLDITNRREGRGRKETHREIHTKRDRDDRQSKE